MNKQVQQFLSTLTKDQCTTNVQKVLLQLLKPSSKDGWVARTSMHVHNATARVRDLRKQRFGAFTVECQSADKLNKRESKVSTQPTFYRLRPESVTLDALKRVFRKGVIIT